MMERGTVFPTGSPAFEKRANLSPAAPEIHSRGGPATIAIRYRFMVNFLFRYSILRYILRREQGPADTRCMRPPAIIASLLAALVAVVLLTRFMWAFSDWNKEQACATAGGRNCAHYGER
jgi:hypothetical protein